MPQAKHRLYLARAILCARYLAAARAPRKMAEASVNHLVPPKRLPLRCVHGLLRVVGGDRVVFTIADPDLLVCGASLREVLAGAPVRRFGGWTAGFVAARDDVPGSLPSRAFRDPAAAGGGYRCRTRIDWLRDWDLLAGPSRPGYGAAGRKNRDVRRRRISTPRNLWADSASAIHGIVYCSAWRLPAREYGRGLDCRSGLGAADACGDFDGGERASRTFWSGLRGLLPKSAAVHSVGAQIRGFVGTSGTRFCGLMLWLKATPPEDRETRKLLAYWVQFGCAQLSEPVTYRAMAVPPTAAIGMTTPKTFFQFVPLLPTP